MHEQELAWIGCSGFEPTPVIAWCRTGCRTRQRFEDLSPITEDLRTAVAQLRCSKVVAKSLWRSGRGMLGRDGRAYACFINSRSSMSKKPACPRIDSPSITATMESYQASNREVLGGVATAALMLSNLCRSTFQVGFH